MSSRAGWLVLCVALWLAPGMARAQPADALKNAQAAFDKAQIDYLQEHYDEAAAGFQAAYDARAFPQFLYNIGAAYHMKGKKNSDPDSYAKAVTYYQRYLSEDPKATDKAKIEKAIGVLEAEITRLKAVVATPPDGSGSGSGSGGSAAPAVVAPSQDVQNLGDVKVHGLVVIDSEPQGANIYLDDKKNGAVAQTPWSGTLDGDHKVIIEKRGYVVSESTVSADPSKLFVLRALLGKENFLGWVEVTSNIPGADVFIDDQNVGAVGKTPHSQNIKPGKHKFWVTTEGYDTYEQDLEVIPGGTHEVKAVLKGAPVGKVNIIGLGIEDSRVYIDGAVACERGPCLKAVAQGKHTLRVTRDGMKPLTKRIDVQAKTEITVKVTLAPEPSRGDAVVAYILAAGFGGGGIYLGLQANKLRDDLRAGATQNPPVDTGDSRFTKGKIYAIAADAAYGIAAITAVTAIYYTFRNKGAPSTGLVDVRAVALQPEVGPGYAGLGMEMHW